MLWKGFWTTHRRRHQHRRRRRRRRCRLRLLLLLLKESMLRLQSFSSSLLPSSFISFCPLSLFPFLASLQAALVYRPFLYVTKSYQQRHFLSLIFTNVFPTFPHLSLSLESFLAWTSRSSDKVAASPPLLIESLAITRWHHFGLWGKLEYVSLLLLLLLPRRRRPISFRKPLTSTESLRQAHELSLLSAKLNIL